MYNMGPPNVVVTRAKIKTYYITIALPEFIAQ